MGLNALHHVTVQTEDLDKTRDFYRDILGLQVGFRPDLDFPGYWLYEGDEGFEKALAEIAQFAIKAAQLPLWEHIRQHIGFSFQRSPRVTSSSPRTLSDPLPWPAGDGSLPAPPAPRARC